MFKKLNKNNLIIRTIALTLLITMMMTANIGVNAQSIDETAAPGNSVTASENAVTTDGGIKRADEENRGSDKPTSDSAVSEAAVDEPEETDHTEIDDSDDVSETSGESIGDEKNTMAAELSGSAVTVDTYAELKSYIEDEKNGYTEFYLGSNIEAKSSGISVPTSKSDITISGKDPDTGDIHTYKELSSEAQANTIVGKANMNIKVVDMTIDGYNFYGTVSSSANNTYIKYERVNYNGPQLCYNPNGTLYIKDSTITVPSSRKPGSAANNEISEVNKLILDGKTVISVLSKTGASTFLMYGNAGTPEIIVKSDSDVTVESEGYFIYQSSGKVQITIESGGSLNANIKGGLSAAGQVLGTINVNDGGLFRYLHTGAAGSLRTIILDGNLNVGNGSTFDVRRTQESTNGTALTKILLSMESANSRIVMDNPKRVILVNALNSTDGLIRFSSGGKLSLNTNAVNIWDLLPTNFYSNIKWDDPINGWYDDDLPSRVFNQKNFETISLTATYSSSSPVNSPAVDISGGYVPAASANTQEITSSNFVGTKTKMFTAGSSNLDFDKISTGNIISGKSPAGSHIDVEYRTASGTTNKWTIADSEGKFSINTGSKLIEGSNVRGMNQIDFLRGYNDSTVENQSGELKFYEIPDSLEFKSDFIPVGDTIIERTNTDWSIKVEDTRNYANNWAVYASMDAPLSTVKNDTTYTLPNSLIYKLGNTAEVLDEQTLIWSGQTDETSDGISTINWDKGEGPLLKVSEGDNIVSDSNYNAKIKWTLVDGPM